MPENLSSELRNWFLSLGFQDKNLTAELIEDEFSRLSPPEMRDIWRNIMAHVVTTQKARFVKKILLINELKTYEKETKQRKLITNNLSSIEEFRRCKNVEKIQKEINNNLRAIQNANARINEQKKQIICLENELTRLEKEKESRNTIQIMTSLKLKAYEETINNLFQFYTFFDCVNSFWQGKPTKEEKSSQMETLKDILKKINGYGKRRNDSMDINLQDEQQSLMDDVTVLTSTISTSELHKTVIYMLRDVLSMLVKLADHVTAKQETEHTRQFELKLTELKKQSVELFMENVHCKRHVDKLRENTENERIKLLSVFTNSLDAGSQKYVETWIDSELLKLSMTTRLHFLQKKEETLKKSYPHSSDFNFTGEFDKEKLFKNVNDYKNQLVLLEREIVNNLCHVTDEPINVFINCQNYCKNKIQEFIQIKNSAKHFDLSAKLTDSLKSEIKLLQKLKFHSGLKNISTSKLVLHDSIIPDYHISEIVKKCSFLLHLMSTCKDSLDKIDYIMPDFEFLNRKKNEIETDEKRFLEEIRKSVTDTKNNLKSIEEYGAACLTNYQLWTKSPNEIIPKQMIAADRNFKEWQKRYSKVIECLRKQQLELNKLV